MNFSMQAVPHADSSIDFTEENVRGYENEVLESFKGGLSYFGDLQYTKSIKCHPQKNGA